MSGGCASGMPVSSTGTEPVEHQDHSDLNDQMDTDHHDESVEQAALNLLAYKASGLGFNSESQQSNLEISSRHVGKRQRSELDDFDSHSLHQNSKDKLPPSLENQGNAFSKDTNKEIDSNAKNTNDSNSKSKTPQYENTSSRQNCPLFIQRDKNSADKDKDLNSLIIGKLLHNLYPGKVVEIKSSGRGKVKVVMNSGRAANKLAADSTLRSKGLIAIIPNSFVTCQGVITDSSQTPVEEILQNIETLGPQGKEIKIINAIRFNRKSTDDKGKVSFIPTNTVLLTFSGTSLPTRVAIYKSIAEVRPYVPEPRICLNCFRFGHIAKQCRSKPRCGKCGGTDPHDESNICSKASTTPHCVNCNGSHSPTSKQCSEFLLQKKIREVATEHKISFNEAKALLNPKNGPNIHNFSNFPQLSDVPAPSATITQERRQFSNQNTYSSTFSSSKKPSANQNSHPSYRTSRPTISPRSDFFASQWNNGRTSSSLPNGFALSPPLSPTSLTPTNAPSPSPTSISPQNFSIPAIISMLSNLLTFLSANCSSDKVKENQRALHDISNSISSLFESLIPNND